MVRSKVRYNLWTEPIVRFWVLENPLKNRTKPNLTIPTSILFLSVTGTEVSHLARQSPKIPYLGEGFGLETTSGGLKNPIPEEEMTDFEP